MARGDTGTGDALTAGAPVVAVSGTLPVVIGAVAVFNTLTFAFEEAATSGVHV